MIYLIYHTLQDLFRPRPDPMLETLARTLLFQAVIGTKKAGHTSPPKVPGQKIGFPGGTEKGTHEPQ
jgi:hypothetical protein